MHSGTGLKTARRPSSQNMVKLFSELIICGQINQEEGDTFVIVAT